MDEASIIELIAVRGMRIAPFCDKSIICFGSQPARSSYFSGQVTQEEFAALYRIPLGTLRDWEQGRCEPDQPSRAYLTVIAHDPEGVKRALAEQVVS